MYSSLVRVVASPLWEFAGLPMHIVNASLSRTVPLIICGPPLLQTAVSIAKSLRCVGDRTEAQIAASRRLVELNKARAEERKKQDAQNAAKEVISQLSSRKTPPQKQPEAAEVVQRPLTNAELWS